MKGKFIGNNQKQFNELNKLTMKQCNFKNLNKRKKYKPTRKT